MILNFPIFCNNLYPELKIHPKIKRRKVLELQEKISKFVVISFLNNLQIDLLKEVFNYFEFRDLRIVSGVSKKFNSLVKEPNPLVFEGDWAKLEKFGKNLFNPDTLYKIELENSLNIQAFNIKYVKCHFFSKMTDFPPRPASLILCNNPDHNLEFACNGNLHNGNRLHFINGRLAYINNDYERFLNYDSYLLKLRVYDLKALFKLNLPKKFPEKISDIIFYYLKLV